MRMLRDYHRNGGEGIQKSRHTVLVKRTWCGSPPLGYLCGFSSAS